MQVFLTSPWVPAEWIRAHDLRPRGVWSEPRFAFDALPLAGGVCAFAQAAVRLGETLGGDAVIFTTQCDQLRRGFDAVCRDASSRMFLFNLPATCETPVARKVFSAELERLGDFLLALGGRPPQTAALEQIMAGYARARRQLIEAAAWASARPYAEAVAQFHWDGSVRLPPQPEGEHWCPPVSPDKNREDRNGRAPAGPVPLALIGGPLPRAHWGLLDSLEAGGGRVALNATEAGERSLWLSRGQPASRELPAPGGLGATSNAGRNPALGALAREYLDNCVEVFQRPNRRLYCWLGERLAARQVRGIVLWHFVGCDLWRAEGQSLREAFGLPLLALDADEAAGGGARAAGRVEAFLESLR